MKNEEIKYKTSTDYERLFQLLKAGNTVVGFMAFHSKNEISKEYSEVVSFSHETTMVNRFHIGNFVLFEDDIEKVPFAVLCKEYNVRFIDIEDAKPETDHVCKFSKSMNQPYPRRCVICFKQEKPV